MIKRIEDIQKLKELIKLFPVTAILGTRQCGKTTLSKELNCDYYFDLENPKDLAKLENPMLIFEHLEGVAVIDEIQRKPELFPLLRYLVDNNQKLKFLILGSASKDLINKSSESLAGRIAYYHLSGFSLCDVGNENVTALWTRGAFPLSFSAQSEKASVLWRENYITTFLERDIPVLGIKIPSMTLRRFWTMLSHYHGQIMNYSEMAKSFGISDMTVRKYIEILEGTFMVRILLPWYSNTGKRLVKSPKIYISDSGIFHSLQSIETYSSLLSHNKLGASWEGFVIELLIRATEKKSNDVFFWSTHSGAEVDLFWHKDGKNFAAEVKYCDAPRITKSMKSSVSDLELEKLFVIYPGDECYKLDEKIDVLSIAAIDKIREEVN
ncbi:MAG TPA: hypothetical protein DD381_05140 [Lentisphaeria bacterium]|nr:MAG: hypothetical protein A2X47_06275 [Lentisphaerae bacterium GWF2_38_69]HBM15716.1 hypothetical protein [Lentisphaeria bacterium]